VLHAIDGGRSYRWIACDPGISKNTVADIGQIRRISSPAGTAPDIAMDWPKTLALVVSIQALTVIVVLQTNGIQGLSRS